MTSNTFFLSFLLLPAVAAQLSTLTDNPLCIKIDNPFQLSGPAAFVDVDASGGTFPTTGDLSISVSLTPPSTPFSTTYFRVHDFDTKAICVITEDQGPYDFSAPTCFLETQIRVCRRSKYDVELSTAVPFPVDGGRGGRRTQQVYPDAEELKEQDRDAITEIKQSPDIRYRCWEGTITAHGTGPDPFAVTGGTGDFYGAFGIIDGAGTFSQSGPNVAFDATVDVCFYPNRL